MSAASSTATNQSNSLVYPRSLWRFCKHTLQGKDPLGYLGPIRDSEAFLAILAAHESQTPATMMSDQYTTHSSRLARPEQAGNFGVLIEFNSSWLDPSKRFRRTVMTRGVYYGNECGGGLANTFEILRTPAIELSNHLFHATGTREFFGIDTSPGRANAAADRILTELSNNEGCIDPSSGECLITGTVHWDGPEVIQMDFTLPPTRGGRPSTKVSWWYSKYGVTTGKPSSRPSSSYASGSQRR